jgi:hypothetical protein
MLRPPCLQAVAMMFPFLDGHPVLLWFRDSDDEVLVSHLMLSIPSSTSRPIAHPAPQACGRCPLGYG